VPGPLAGVALVVASLLIGAVPWGFLAGKASRGIDLRAVGSGGTGATNVLRTLGPRASAVVALLDILKGLLPVVLARSAGFDPAWVAAAAVATVVGHCWSPFIGFKGGKGVATGAGAAIALFPYVLVIVPVMGFVVWTTKYVSLGSLIAAGLGALLAVIYAAAGRLDWIFAIAIVAIGGIIAVRHESNIRRLMQGSERRIGETIAS
jgi:acyl phosphate:glycerol-3-phosphate acyltransferase